MSKMKLFGEPGWGSVLTEAQLVWYGIPYEFRRVGDLFADENASRELQAINPLAQIPTLVLPDGSVMTESAAITLWLAEQSASGDLVPEPNAPERARFLRWLIFITSNIYPTYTYADDPARFVSHKTARAGFLDTVNQYATKLYGILNAEASSPWFLGDRFSALDIYVCTLTHWRPKRPWFEANTPNLIAIADATTAVPRLTKVWVKNFPDN
jgi:GST-like protein